MILVLVFAGVSAGALIAGGLIATGLKLPIARADATPDRARAGAAVVPEGAASQPRSTRVAQAAAAAERRDAALFISGSAAGERGEAGGSDRRATGVAPVDRGLREIMPDARLGQATRRSVRPRSARSGGRSTPSNSSGSAR